MSHPVLLRFVKGGGVCHVLAVLQAVQELLLEMAIPDDPFCPSLDLVEHCEVRGSCLILSETRVLQRGVDM